MNQLFPNNWFPMLQIHRFSRILIFFEVIWKAVAGIILAYKVAEVNAKEMAKQTKQVNLQAVLFLKVLISKILYICYLIEIIK